MTLDEIKAARLRAENSVVRPLRYNGREYYLINRQGGVVDTSDMSEARIEELMGLSVAPFELHNPKHVMARLVV